MKKQQAPFEYKHLKRRKNVAAVGASMPNVLKFMGRKQGFSEGVLVTNWGKICPEFVKYSYPQRLAGNTLTIAVNSDSAKTELMMWKPTLMQRLNMFLGYDAVTSIRFIVRSFAHRETQLVKPSPTASKEGLAKAKETCHDVADDDLKAALERLGALIYTK